MFKLDEPDDVGDGDGTPSWVVFTDKHTKRLCYYNMSTEEQSWEKPKGVDDKDIVFTDENHLMSSLPDPEGLDDDFAENNRPFVKPDFKLAMEHRCQGLQEDRILCILISVVITHIVSLMISF